MKKKRNLWKQGISLLMAGMLVFTAVPVTALAETGAGSGLENIAADCTITVPSEQNSDKSKDKMVDGDTGTMWVNNGAQWPATVEFALPASNTKCVKKVVVKFENQTNRSMDVSLKYALNGVTSDLIAVEGS